MARGGERVIIKVPKSVTYYLNYPKCFGNEELINLHATGIYNIQLF